MNSTWAYNEFKALDLGDQRLNNRLVKLAEDFAAIRNVSLKYFPISTYISNSSN